MSAFTVIISLVFLIETATCFAKIKKPDIQFASIRQLLEVIEGRAIRTTICYAVACWLALLWSPETSAEKWLRILYVVIPGIAAMFAHLMRDAAIHIFQTKREEVLGGR